MSSRCEQAGYYCGLGLAGGIFGTLSGYAASAILSDPPENGLIFGAVAGVSFPILSKISNALVEATCCRRFTCLPLSCAVVGSALVGYAAHELTKPDVELETPFYKLAGLTYTIGLATFTGLNMAYCAMKKSRPERKTAEPYVSLSDDET